MVLYRLSYIPWMATPSGNLLWRCSPLCFNNYRLAHSFSSVEEDGNNITHCHPREAEGRVGDPEDYWIPAFAGMTLVGGKLRYVR